MSIVDIHKKRGKRPDFDVYIGRAVKRTEFIENSKWYNPFTAKEFGLYNALRLYEEHINVMIKLFPEKYNLEELIGKKLGCWCITTDELEPLVCHGQILLKLIREKYGIQIHL